MNEFERNAYIDLKGRIAKLQADLDALSSEVDEKSTVSFTQTRTSGEEIGTITIDDMPTKLYAPEVSFTQTLTSGEEIGTITIDDTPTKLYAPEIPAEKHIEWVTVSTGTADTTNLSQFTELYAVFSNLSEKEKSLTRLKADKFVCGLLNVNGIFSYNSTTSVASDNYEVRIDTGRESYSRCRIMGDSITFNDYVNDTASSAWELQVLRLVDNV